MLHETRAARRLRRVVFACLVLVPGLAAAESADSLEIGRAHV